MRAFNNKFSKSNSYFVFILIFLIVASFILLKSHLNELLIIETGKAPKAIGPYTQAVAFEKFVFTSGQIGINPATNLLDTSSFQTEVKQTMNNLKEVLIAGGTSFKSVAKVTVYLKDLNKFQEFNAIYAEYFPDTKPARETVEVKNLPKNANIEISAIAIKE